MKGLYITYCRPLLEYASSVWSPHLLKDIEKLERVQRRYSKRIPALSNFDYKTRLQKLSVRTLEERRLIADLIQVYKIFHGIDNVDVKQFFNVVRTNRSSRGHSFKIFLPFARTDVRKYWFGMRVIDPWNSLPEDIVSAPSINIFKTKILQRDFSKYLKYKI